MKKIINLLCIGIFVFISNIDLCKGGDYLSWKLFVDCLGHSNTPICVGVNETKKKLEAPGNSARTNFGCLNHTVSRTYKKQGDRLTRKEGSEAEFSEDTNGKFIPYKMHLNGEAEGTDVKCYVDENSFYSIYDNYKVVDKKLEQRGGDKTFYVLNTHTQIVDAINVVTKSNDNEKIYTSEDSSIIISGNVIGSWAQYNIDDFDKKNKTEQYGFSLAATKSFSETVDIVKDLKLSLGYVRSTSKFDFVNKTTKSVVDCKVKQNILIGSLAWEYAQIENNVTTFDLNIGAGIASARSKHKCIISSGNLTETADSFKHNDTIVFAYIDGVKYFDMGVVNAGPFINAMIVNTKQKFVSTTSLNSTIGLAAKKVCYYNNDKKFDIFGRVGFKNRSKLSGKLDNITKHDDFTIISDKNNKNSVILNLGMNYQVGNDTVLHGDIQFEKGKKSHLYAFGLGIDQKF